MTLHREGRLIIVITVLVVVFLNIAIFEWVHIRAVQNAILILSGILALLIIQFFRLPKRTSNPNAELVFCPCDGKVVVIEEVMEEEFLMEKALQISIFMSPVNVHANWFPISGKVIYDKYHPGKYLVAWHPKSSTENERTTICVETDKGHRVLFRQIAGALARRIKYYVKTGDLAEQGKEFGFIKFGSRVDVFIPTNSEVMVKIGDRVKGIRSVLAELK